MNVTAFPISDKLFIDPTRVIRRLSQSLRTDPDEVIASTNSPDPSIAGEATDRFVKALRFAFDMPFDPLTGEGWLESNLIELHNRFASWLDEKKNSIVTSPTSVVSTESPCKGCRKTRS